MKPFSKKISIAFWVSAFFFLGLLIATLILRSDNSEKTSNNFEKQKSLDESELYTWIKMLEKRLLFPTKSKDGDLKNSARRGTVTEVIEMPAENQIWWVQLGAYASEEQATGRWKKFQLIYSGLLAEREPDILAEGSLFKLRVGAFSQESVAEDFCQNLKKQGGECFLIQ